jgi:hypothetical protein
MDNQSSDPVSLSPLHYYTLLQLNPATRLRRGWKHCRASAQLIHKPPQLRYGCTAAMIVAACMLLQVASTDICMIIEHLYMLQAAELSAEQLLVRSLLQRSTDCSLACSLGSRRELSFLQCTEPASLSLSPLHYYT